MAVAAIWKLACSHSRAPRRIRSAQTMTVHVKRVLNALLASVLSVSSVVTCLSATSSAPVFREISPKGLDFTLQNSPTSLKYLIETMPGGVALLDYNNDCLLDIFLVNSGRITNPIQQPDNFDRRNQRYWNRLYRQNRDGSFTDV